MDRWQAMLMGYTWIRPGPRQCGPDPERMICDNGRVWHWHNDKVDQGGGNRIEAICDTHVLVLLVCPLCLCARLCACLSCFYVLVLLMCLPCLCAYPACVLVLLVCPFYSCARLSCLCARLFCLCPCYCLCCCSCADFLSLFCSCCCNVAVLALCPRLAVLTVLYCFPCCPCPPVLAVLVLLSLWSCYCPCCRSALSRSQHRGMTVQRRPIGIRNPPQQNQTCTCPHTWEPTADFAFFQTMLVAVCHVPLLPPYYS